ncbi:ABC transporter ATP-binding protein [Aquabacterium sp. OR-4]|uniref:ABC transporter ATP-binding protein n=1 Tax=Aquabacterium sp. OR-4 TaxID=2978127 RepID=UPI0021B3AC5F|nr:ABC transporter ATP-binding protein [Aquabacterium sp. OR-4]MDT7833844.1 ABC transporter ATP-binding protein [Aquabacterium sp. OR-4]
MLNASPAAAPPDPAPLIALHQVHKRFAGGRTEGTQALAGVSLAVRAGEFVSLLGPSGCGKSTVLRLVAGLDDADAGTVAAPARQHGADAATAFVFQEPTLMPWATVADNVALPLKLQGQRRSQTTPRVAEVLARVGLADFAGAYPAQLSGGMKMRASIARALVTAPRVLLMDEPFAALDDITRQRLNADLLQWWQAQRLAALFVTHSVAEAVYLSQRVLVMAARPGRVLAEVVINAPYPRPADWRHTPEFAAACRGLSQALAEAAEPVAVPATAAAPAAAAAAAAPRP